jgi:sucrose-6-phosphate hydrolase SacC (GH32 family)
MKLRELEGGILLIEDFEVETGTYRKWKTTGNAFDVFGTPYLFDTTYLRNVYRAEGFQGAHLICSEVNGPTATGAVTSPAFIIERPFFNFLIGGGGADVYVSLEVEGRVVFREKAPRTQTRMMLWVSRDVSAYLGKSARIRIVDKSSGIGTNGAWESIAADYFCLSNEPIGTYGRTKIRIEKPYLNFPIAYGPSLFSRISLSVDGGQGYEIDLRLSPEPDYWTYLNTEKWIGREIDIVLTANGVDTKEYYDAALDLIYQSDEPGEKAAFYTERLRPRVHYTVARSWLTDVCGVFYYNGWWHLQYQRNPFGVDWGNIHWGHAVSKDLVHWEELDNSLVPDEMGPIFAGYSAVDEENVLGLQKGPEKTIVSFYTSAGGFAPAQGKLHTQSLAYSIDGGFTWTKYSNNPALETLVFDNRDPQIYRDEDHNQWVMVLFLIGNTYGFYRSDNLVDWTELSRYDFPGEWECPDFYKIKVEETGEYKWVLSGVHGIYQVGAWDGRRFTPETAPRDQDFGPMSFVQHLFYNAPDGRRVQISNTGDPFGSKVPFRNMMTFPREIKLRKKGGDYILYGVPAAELSLLHREEHRYNGSGLPWTLGVPTPAYRLSAVFSIPEEGVINIAMNDIDFTYEAGRFQIRNAGMLVQSLSVVPVNGKLSVELLSDVGFMEVFLNDGEINGTMFQSFEDLGKTDITIKAEGGAAMDSCVVRELGSIWEDK